MCKDIVSPSPATRVQTLGSVTTNDQVWVTRCEHIVNVVTPRYTMAGNMCRGVVPRAGVWSPRAGSGQGELGVCSHPSNQVTSLPDTDGILTY